MLRDRIAALDDEAGAQVAEWLPAGRERARARDRAERARRGLPGRPRARAAGDAAEESEEQEIELGDIEIEVDDERAGRRTRQPAHGRARAGGPAAPEVAAQRAARSGAGDSASTSQQIGEDLEEADFYFQQGLHAEAEAIYQRVLALAPNHPLALVRLGEIAAAQGSDPGVDRRRLAAATHPSTDGEAADGGVRHRDRSRPGGLERRSGRRAGGRGGERGRSGERSRDRGRGREVRSARRPPRTTRPTRRRRRSAAEAASLSSRPKRSRSPRTRRKKTRTSRSIPTATPRRIRARTAPAHGAALGRLRGELRPRGRALRGLRRRRERPLGKRGRRRRRRLRVGLRRVQEGREPDALGGRSRSPLRPRHRLSRDGSARRRGLGVPRRDGEPGAPDRLPAHAGPVHARAGRRRRLGALLRAGARRAGSDAGAAARGALRARPRLRCARRPGPRARRLRGRGRHRSDLLRRRGVAGADRRETPSPRRSALRRRRASNRSRI